MYLYLNTASIIRILSDVRQNSFTHLLYTYHVFVFLFFSDRGEKYTAVYKSSLRYILRLYIVTLLFQRLPTQFIHTYSYYFQLPPPPLSSFDLLFLLGVGGARMQKVHEHASIARSGKKKF